MTQTAQTEADPTGAKGSAGDVSVAGTPQAASADTRDRILDVALDLFTEQGFDGTSLRQIAEPLGITKAALYYHFASKDDILLALHMRLHEFGREALASMGDQPMTLQRWGSLLEQVTDQMMAQRKIFLLHERNRASLEKLHRNEHDAAHEDMEARFRDVLADRRVPLRDRVRMAASFGIIFSALFLSGEAFSTADTMEVRDLLRDVVRDVLEG